MVRVCGITTRARARRRPRGRGAAARVASSGRTIVCVWHHHLCARSPPNLAGEARAAAAAAAAAEGGGDGGPDDDGAATAARSAVLDAMRGEVIESRRAWCHVAMWIIGAAVLGLKDPFV